MSDVVNLGAIGDQLGVVLLQGNSTLLVVYLYEQVCLSSCRPAEARGCTIATPVFGWDPVFGDIAVGHAVQVR